MPSFADIVQAKTQLRAQMLLTRKQIRNKQQRSEQIAQIVLQHPKFQTAKTMAIYISLPDEVASQPIIKKAWQLEKQLFVPAGSELRGDLYVKAYPPKAKLGPNGWGVLEPISNIIYPLSRIKLDLIILPGLAFSAKGDRLGYGKGYYDRFLERAKGAYTIGLAFKEQLLASIPVNKLDRPVAEVITA